MGYRLNRLDEPVLMAVPKPMQIEFGIHHRLESCVTHNRYVSSKSASIYCGLNEPVFMAGSKPLLTEFGFYLILEGCVAVITPKY